MSRLGATEWLLLCLGVPLWLGWFGLFLHEAREHGSGEIPIFASPTDDYPVVGGLRPTRTSDLGDLRIGDRLVRVGELDLRGAGYLSFEALASSQMGGDFEAPLVYERDGVRATVPLRMEPSAHPLAPVPALLAFFVLGVAVLVRAPPGRAPRALFGAMLIMTFMQMPLRSTSYAQTLFYVTAFALGGGFGSMLTLRFAILFPDERSRSHAISRHWAWLAVAVYLPLRLCYILGGPIPPASVPTLVLIADALFLSSVIAVFTWSFLKSGPIGRRQIKWLALGIWLGVLPMAIGIAAATRWPAHTDALIALTAFVMVITPLTCLVSILRFDLFDIDRLLSATASYNVVLVILAAGALVGVPRVAEAASQLLGIDPDTGQLALSLGLATLVVPANRFLRPQVDRLFFRERYDLESGVEILREELARCRDSRELVQAVGSGVQRLIRPDVTIVYGRIDESYVPLFVDGRAAPSAFPNSGPLVQTLLERVRPLALRRGDGAARDEVGPFERAALETLEAEVLVPIRQSGALTALLCLGPKRSGDVYTATDLAHLGSLSERAGMELQRFDQEESLRQAREMQAALRSYVPGVIAEQLSQGADLSSREREVSVFFVDIRGYTRFSEGRRAEEIFRTVNRYTETVSQIVASHGGAVVEFNGDGMMAVFGAPRELEHKERAAVRAARETVDSVARIPVTDGSVLSVGVGIATGSAFVGNIQAVDRFIWSAIGNTTNLAARLQSLTRELDASVVIDTATWNAVGPDGRDFELHASLAIRGRSDARDVYALRSQAG